MKEEPGSKRTKMTGFEGGNGDIVEQFKSQKDRTKKSSRFSKSQGRYGPRVTTRESTMTEVLRNKVGGGETWSETSNIDWN